MKLVLTGAAGFLGWHTRLRLQALGIEHEVVPVSRSNWRSLPKLMHDADAVIHIAGVNRAEDPETVQLGNEMLADDLATALRGTSGVRVVYANSAQAGNGTPYGNGKQAAADALASAADDSGGSFVDVRLPNIFGEHGRPRYNSFVATFVDSAIRGHEPTIQDNEVPLLHAQDAAATLIDGLTTSKSRLDPHANMQDVRTVWKLLSEFTDPYRSGELPDLSNKLSVDLFNTYRAALFPQAYPLNLTPNTDHRGTFVETVRVRGGEGQSSISTTAPGITRGEHFHLRKIERFVVVEGTASIRLRRLFQDEIFTFEVSGDRPVAIDMPTGWAHNITNTGPNTLITQFWSHELFRSDAPDTYPETVQPALPERTT